MKSVYPVFIIQNKKDYSVYVPDMDIYTEGNSLSDAIEMARDAIGLKGISLEDSGRAFPRSSNYADAVKKAKEDGGERLDYSSGVLTMVDIDFAEYRRMHDNRMVKKNCTIPYSLNVEAEKYGLNFSRILQEALIEQLSILKMQEEIANYRGEENAPPSTRKEAQRKRLIKYAEILKQFD